jgi:hypothetical protein
MASRKEGLTELREASPHQGKTSIIFSGDEKSLTSEMLYLLSNSSNESMAMRAG